MGINNLSSIKTQLESHPFVPSRLLQNLHIQTLFARFVPYFTNPSLPTHERRFIKHPDGSQLAADCWWQKDKGRATIIVINGFEGFRGNERSRFTKQIISKAYHFGFNIIHLRQRGEGDTAKLTHSLMTYLERDLAVSLNQIIDWGIKKIYLIGFSSGGYVSLFEVPQLEKKIQKSILGMIAIAAPINLFDTWNHVEQRAFYNWALLRTYKYFIKRRLTIDPPDAWDKSALKKIKTKHQLFETYQHMWGYPEKFSSLEDYHDKTNIIPLLPKIQIPTLIIHASDDPVAPINPFLYLNNPYIITLLTKHGGHGGFFTTKKLYGDLDGHWAQNRAIEFIQLLEGGLNNGC